MLNSRVLIIIPAYNEEASIKKTVEAISKTPYDYIVINDGSTDNTINLLKQSNFNHINLVSNLGIGGAVQTGYKYALENNYDIAIQFDADGQHDVSYINNLIEPIIKKQANLVIGSSFVDKTSKNQRSSKIRRVGIAFLSSIIKLFSGYKIHDPTSGFRATDRTIIQYFANDYPQEYPEPISNYELLRSNQFVVKEVPVKMNKRQAGKSSISPWKSIYAALNVLISIIIISPKFKQEKRSKND